MELGNIKLEEHMSESSMYILHFLGIQESIYNPIMWIDQSGAGMSWEPESVLVGLTLDLTGSLVLWASTWSLGS